jgi:hypothetical protein
MLTAGYCLEDKPDDKRNIIKNLSTKNWAYLVNATKGTSSSRTHWTKNRRIRRSKRRKKMKTPRMRGRFLEKSKL